MYILENSHFEPQKMEVWKGNTNLEMYQVKVSKIDNVNQESHWPELVAMLFPRFSGGLLRRAIQTNSVFFSWEFFFS